MKFAYFLPTLFVKRSYLLLPASMLFALAGCHHSNAPQGNFLPLDLKSSSFNADSIPAQYSCDGSDSSPELSWNQVPAHTQSFVLTVLDPDAPLGSFVHWLLYDIPADKHELAQGVPSRGELEDGSHQGKNGFDKIGYGGPCPPGKSTHRYFFTLYALDTRLNLPAGASEKQLNDAMQGHVLAKGLLVGRFHH